MVRQALGCTLGDIEIYVISHGQGGTSLRRLFPGMKLDLLAFFHFRFAVILSVITWFGVSLVAWRTSRVTPCQRGADPVIG